MKTNLRIPVFAAIAAVALAFGTLSFSTKKDSTIQTDKVGSLDHNYFYTYTGNPSHEDDESLWTLISESDYIDSACNKFKNGCVIKTKSSSETAPTHPALVPVTGSGSNMTPVVDNNNIVAAKFKNPL